MSEVNELDKPCPKSKKQKKQDKEKASKTLSVPPDEGEMVEHHIDPTDTHSISEAEKAAREKIRELINMGRGSRTDRLKLWSEKYQL